MVTFNRKPETMHERPRSGLRRFYKHAPMLDAGGRSAGCAAATHRKLMHPRIESVSSDPQEEQPH